MLVRPVLLILVLTAAGLSPLLARLIFAIGLPQWLPCQPFHVVGLKPLPLVAVDILYAIGHVIPVVAFQISKLGHDNHDIVVCWGVC